MIQTRSVFPSVRRRFVRAAAAISTLLVLLDASAAQAAEPAAEDATKVPMPAGLVQPGATAKVAALVCFFEGPAADAAGNVDFSDVTGNRILKMTAPGAVSVFRSDSGRANGNAFDASGRLVTCEGFGLGPGGRRRVESCART
jgi:gluconolactonase